MLFYCVHIELNYLPMKMLM